jgi:hypothetical protein
MLKNVLEVNNVKNINTNSKPNPEGRLRYTVVLFTA